MKNKKGYTIVEVIVSFVLITVVMIYLLRTVIVLTNKNNDLLVNEEYSVYENNLLKHVYDDLEVAYDAEDFKGVTEESGKIKLKDIDKDIEVNKDNNQIIYGGTIYELPDKVSIRENSDHKTYKVEKHLGTHEYYVITIYIKKNRDNEDLKIVYQNKKLLDYTITFNPNGGQIISGETEVVGKFGQEVQVPTVQKTGYTFKGWFANGKKLEKNTVTIKTTIQYTANWEANTFTVAYAGNGATGGTTTSHICTYDQECYLKANGFTKTGYTFQGWKKGNAGNMLAPGASIKNAATSGTVTYYAQWKANTFTVAYNGNGATGGTTTSHTCTYDAACSLKANGFTRTGYTFQGWKKANAGYVLAPNVSIKNAATSGTVTYYAQWKANNYTLVFEPAGGLVSPNKKTVTYDSKYGTLPTPSRPGYTFTGWYNSSGASRNANSVYKTVGNETLTAHWKANTYTITFNPNGGSVSPKTKTVTYDSTYGSLPTPSRGGYIFIGWYTSGSFNATYYSNTYKDVRNVYGTSYQGLMDHWVKWGKAEGRRSSANYRLPDDKYTTAGNETLTAQWIRYGSDSSCGCSSYNTCQHSDCGTTANTSTSCGSWVNNGDCDYYGQTSSCSVGSTGCNIPGFGDICTYKNGYLTHRYKISSCTKKNGKYSPYYCFQDRRCTTSTSYTTNTCATAACGCSSYNSCYY